MYCTILNDLILSIEKIKIENELNEIHTEKTLELIEWCVVNFDTINEKFSKLANDLRMKVFFHKSNLTSIEKANSFAAQYQNEVLKKGIDLIFKSQNKRCINWNEIIDFSSDLWQNETRLKSELFIFSFSNKGAERALNQ